jgi:CheY-like chemotaxis protein
MGETKAAARGERANILVVDDSADNRLTLESILSEPGQNVVTAASGRDALRRLLEQEFAVILLDVNMPMMDGFETAAMVRQRKSSERTPIIFITAFSDETHVSRGYSLGAVDYIVSPVVPEVLRSKVAVFVDLFRKTEQIRRQAESLRRRADQLYHLTEASLAINSVNSLGEILEIVTETARDLLAPRCALTTTTLDQAQGPARAALPDMLAESGAEECDHQRFLAQAAAMSGALADQGRTVLITPRELASEPRWRFLGEAEGLGHGEDGGDGDGDEDGSGEASDQRLGGEDARGEGAGGSDGGGAVAGGRGTAGDLGGEGAALNALAALTDGAAPPRRPERLSGAAESGWLAAPLTGRDGRSFGWVHLAGRAQGQGGEFGNEDKTILTQLAQVASIAIENILSSEAREANRLKDEFLTTLSHELRTPLTAILGWTRVLRTTPFDEARCGHGLEVIERNVAAQAKLIEDLLDVSRIIAGKLRVTLRTIPLLSSIEAAVEAMRPAAEAKGMSLDLVIGPEVDHQELISGDAERLQQVGWNLVSNAIKFTPAGGKIVIAVGRVPGGYQIRVTDTGKGISPQFLRHVFDRFRQDDSSSTRAHGGLGIGLAIVQHIVELHGGRVEAESPGVNRGATFTVTLPELPASLAQAALQEAAGTAPIPPMPPLPGGAGEEAGAAAISQPPAASAASATSDAAAGVDLGKLKMLVVDDEPDTREILSEILRSAGATVATAGSLNEALALCDRFRPDLLISDIAMPGGDGYALIRQLRRRGRERGGAIPALAVSAHAREEDRRRALAAGFERYVTKPVEPADLIAAVREIAVGLPASAPPLAPAARGGGGEAAAEGAGTEAAGGEAEAASGAEDASGGGAPAAGRAKEAGGSRAEAAGGTDAAAGRPAPAVRGGGRNGRRRAVRQREASGAAEPPSGDAGARRILLVEDDADTREALKTLLELSGHHVEVAADGGEAVAHAIANRPDVALVDIGLPEIDGNEVARRIRASLGASGIFLVALTGYGGDADEELARAAGFDAHFTKPVELSRLDRLLRTSGRLAQ